jgi:hypothetical protein
LKERYHLEEKDVYESAVLKGVFKDVRWNDANRFHTPQNGDQWLALVNSVINPVVT